MDFSRFMTFCLALVAMMAMALTAPCLCKTAQAGQASGDEFPCCPTQGEPGQNQDSQGSTCGCGCAEVNGDEQTSLQVSVSNGLVQERESLDAPLALSATAKALLFVWFAHFVDDVSTEDAPVYAAPPSISSPTPNYLELQVLRI